jgi:hypothetical protein
LSRPGSIRTRRGRIVRAEPHASPPLEIEGHRVIALRPGASVTLLGSGSSASPLAPDDVIEFPFGLEEKTARALVREGTIPAARLGRKLYARRSAVLGAIDVIAEEQRAARAIQAKPGTSAPEQYAQIVELARAKRAGGAR